MESFDTKNPEEYSKKARARLHRLAWILDSSVRLPGGFTIGLDGLIGLIPGLGDVVGAAFSSYIISAAAQFNVPANVLIRMGLNVALELFIGSIPLVGDVFDFVFKANERNVRLLDAHLDEPVRTRAQSRLIVLGLAAALALLLGFAIAIFIGMIRLLWSTVGG